MKKVNVGLIGAGFAAVLHAEAYKKVYGLHVNIKAVASVDKTVGEFAEKYHISDIYDDYKEMLKDPEIDIIDICTPPHLHVQMLIDVLEAEKHVICEKPLTGYFKAANENDNIGHTVPKSVMYKEVMEEMDKLKQIVDKSDKIFMYAENFVYAPSIGKSEELIRVTKNKILFMKGEESHSGSHAHHAANWKYTGGGALIRQGCHPLSAVLYLKSVEAEARGEEISVQSVVGDMGVTTDCINEEDKKFIDARPVDVEDCANVIITFSDGTKANIIAGDMIVGGVRNLVEVYTNEAVHMCNITPNNHMSVYHADDSKLADVYITEKVETKKGWQNVCIDEEITRGYVGELQDFMECVVENRQPKSDFKLAYDTAQVIYGAYLSAEEGKRIDF